MSPLESQLAMLPIYVVLLVAFGLALWLVWRDLERSLLERLREDNPELQFDSLFRPGRLPDQARVVDHAPRRARPCRPTEGTGSSGWQR